MKSWWESLVFQSLVSSALVGWDIMETFLRKIGQDAWEPKHLVCNQEADHDLADHKTTVRETTMSAHPGTGSHFS